MSKNIEWFKKAKFGIKPSPKGLYETAATMNNTWGFSYHDHNWKSAEKIYELKKHLNNLGINYLLNIGLDGDLSPSILIV